MEENSLPPSPINITRYTMSRISVQYIHYVTYFVKKIKNFFGRDKLQVPNVVVLIRIIVVPSL